MISLEVSEWSEVTSWSTKALSEYVGGLSNPSKMPGFGFSLPAKECRTGSKLRLVESSTCSGCYAMKGRYSFSNVQSALYKRFAALYAPLWVPVMAELITRKGGEWFRWHDSGDLQSVEHLKRIISVCELTPHVRHWLPTREYRIVSDYLKSGGTVPENLAIRMSAHMLGGSLPSFSAPLSTSTVSRSDETYPLAHHCPARFQGNSCGDCRACWDRDIPHVDYHAH